MTDVATIAAELDDRLIVVVGPTASGKSSLAMALCEAVGGELIGADSVQIYRYFDLGSGKPSQADRARVPHHLVDFVEPGEPFDAARFVDLADDAIRDIRSRGRTPIVCGGTFLWIKALLFGLANMPPADPAVRARHEARAEAEGRAALHRELAEIDPPRAEVLAPNDLVRVSRALEVFELTGKTLTAWHAEHRFAEVRHEAQLLGVERDRTVLDTRIRARTRAWLDAGWIDAVRALLPEHADARAMEAVGFRQVRDHLRGELAEADLEDTIVRATRKFVRRQRTWLRDQPVRWLAPLSP